MQYADKSSLTGTGQSSQQGDVNASQNELSRLLGRIEGAFKYANEVANDLHAIADRALGSAPMPPTEAPSKAQVHQILPLVSAIDEAITALENEYARINAARARLSRLA